MWSWVICTIINLTVAVAVFWHVRRVLFRLEVLDEDGSSDEVGSVSPFYQQKPASDLNKCDCSWSLFGADDECSFCCSPFSMICRLTVYCHIRGKHYSLVGFHLSKSLIMSHSIIMNYFWSSSSIRFKAELHGWWHTDANPRAAPQKPCMLEN